MFDRSATKSALALSRLLGTDCTQCGFRLKSDSRGTYCNVCESPGRGRKYAHIFRRRSEPILLKEPRICTVCGHETLRPEGGGTPIYVNVIDRENKKSYHFDCCHGCGRITDDEERAVAEEVTARARALWEKKQAESGGE